jgi:uncharacterized protein YjiS (DUF1127 family)
MLKQLYRAIVTSRSATAAANSMQYLSDSLLHDIGVSRDTFVEGVKARIFAELDATEAGSTFAAPVNEDLLGAV